MFSGFGPCSEDVIKFFFSQVTFQNEENQIYLMEFSNGRLVDATLNLLKLLSREVAVYWPPGAKSSLSNLLSETLSNLMKVVMNLTHDSNDDCKLDYISYLIYFCFNK